MIKKKFIFFIIIFFNFAAIFGASFQYDNMVSNGISFYSYGVYNLDSSLYLATNQDPNYDPIYSNISNHFPTYEFQNSGSIIKNWLSTTSCDLSLVGTKNVNANFDITGNKLTVVNYLKTNGNIVIGNIGETGQTILNTNLWMKADVNYELIGPKSNLILTGTKTILIDNIGVTIPQSPFTQSDIDSLPVSHGYGTYTVKATVTPIDEKCNFFGTGIIGTSTTPIEIQNFTRIAPDADSDGIADTLDSCIDISGYSKFKGCPTEYSQVGTCVNPGAVSFNGSQLHCYYYDSPPFWYDNNNYFKSPSGIRLFPTTDTNVYLNPDQGSGIYTCYNVNTFSDSQVGSCELRHNLVQACSNGLAAGETRDYYKYSKILPSEINDNNIFKTVDCSYGILKIGTTNFDLATSEFKFPKSSVKVLHQDYENVIRNPDGTLTLNDTSTQGKVSCASTDLNCNIKISGTVTSIDLNNLNRTSNQNVKIYKQGILNRTESVDTKIIALNSHKIKKFKTVDESIDFINKSVQLMEKFDIIKNLSYDINSNITSVEIKTENFAEIGIVNLTIYQVFDKSIANNYDNIIFISDGGAERIVVDKDPIVGWYFNETTGNTSIQYNVSGNNEGGTIIIAQEPILFNEGELVINYRESGCSAGEVHLFDLGNLEASNILNKGAGNYSVCITHLDSGIILTEGTDVNKLNISSFDWNSNISSNFNELTNKLELSTARTDIYWDKKIQSLNPNGNYSCLGSYNKLNQSSFFGDCGYNTENRIWLHLGIDDIAPTTNYVIPYLGHSVNLEIIANDNIGGSGINKTYYCIIEDTNPCQNQGDFTIYNSPFVLTCTSDWSCTRTLKFYSTDFAGNKETIKTEDLYLIDKGSACQADCTAKPAPNRYLKECRNLNGCFYSETIGETGNDIGKAVAESCNFLVENSYVSYNLTHDIKCPNGPFKIKKFTDKRLTFSGSNCEEVIKLPYPIIYEGERVIMNIVTCINN